MTLDLVIYLVVDSLRIIGLAILGAYMAAQSGRYFADFKDVKAAVFFGIGLVLLVIAVKGA